MRRATALASLLLAACGRPDAGTKTACPHDPSFDRSGVIRVRAAIPPAVVRRDLDLAGLARESGGTAGSGKLQGLTEVEHRLAFHNLANGEFASGKVCVWFDEVNVDLTPASVLIFVPREYDENSCESITVLQHEREHVRVHEERLTAAATEMREALLAAKWLPARGNPLEVADLEEAKKLLNDKIRKVIAPAYDKYKADLAAAQADLDRPELYDWVTKRCPGWK